MTVALEPSRNIFPVPADTGVSYTSILRVNGRISHVDEKKFHEKVLYRMRHNKYDSLRKSYNKVIKNKVNDVKQGLYQTIYLTLTIMAEDVADAKAHLVLWRVP